MTNIISSRMKRREKDNAKRAQSRKWYFEKNDWIESDEIEDEASEEKIEEEEKEEEEIVIKTVPVGDGQKNTACPVCREDFDQFYKQVWTDQGIFTVILMFVSVERRGCGGGGLVFSQRHDP